MVGAARCGDRVDPRPGADGAGGGDPPPGRAEARGSRATATGRCDCSWPRARGTTCSRRSGEALVQLGAPEDPALAQLWSALLPPSLRRRAGGAAAADGRGDRRRPGGELRARRAHGGGVRGAGRRRRRDRVARPTRGHRLRARWTPGASSRTCTGSRSWPRPVTLGGGVGRRVSRGGCPARPTGLARGRGDPRARGRGAVRRTSTQGLAGYFCARAQLEGGRLQEAARTIDWMPDDHRERMHDGVLGVRAAVAQGLGSTDAVLDAIRAVAETHVDRRPLVARRNARLSGWRSDAATVGDLEGAREQLLELELLGGPDDATLDEELLARPAVAVAAGVTRTKQSSCSQPHPGPWCALPATRAGCVAVRAAPRRPRLATTRSISEGVHAERRAFAAALVAARAGDAEPFGRYPWPRHGVVRWFAPVPWITEAAVYAAAAEAIPRSTRTIAAGDRGAAQRDVLRRPGGITEPAVAPGRGALAASLPVAAPDPVGCTVLGPLEVRIDGVSSTDPSSGASGCGRCSACSSCAVRCGGRRRPALLWPDLTDEQSLAEPAGHADRTCSSSSNLDGTGVRHRSSSSRSRIG